MTREKMTEKNHEFDTCMIDQINPTGLSVSQPHKKNKILGSAHADYWLQCLSLIFISAIWLAAQNINIIVRIIIYIPILWYFINDIFTRYVFHGSYIEVIRPFRSNAKIFSTEITSVGFVSTASFVTGTVISIAYSGKRRGGVAFKYQAHDFLFRFIVLNKLNVRNRGALEWVDEGISQALKDIRLDTP